MQHYPLITVGLTCYNAAETIIRSINSALEQDYPAFEILVVDDGSRDRSAQIIQDYIADKPKVRLILHKTNSGFPSALNTLVEQARGDYIAFFDDDDVSCPDRLKKQIERITTFSQLRGTDKILCYSNRAIIRAGESSPHHIALAIGRTAPEPSGEDVADFILWHAHNRETVWGLFGSCTLMMKTSYLRQIGGFDPDFRRSAEWDMAVRAARDGASFIAVDEPLITQHKTATSDKSGKIPLHYALKLRQKYKGYLQSKGVYAAALCLTRYQYYHGQKNRLFGLFWMGVACCLAPKKIFWEKFSYALSQPKETAPESGVFSRDINGYSG